MACTRTARIVAVVSFLLICTPPGSEAEDPGLVGRCDESGSPTNVTRQELEMYGKCVPYMRPSEGGPCDSQFREGADYVFVPNQRVSGSLRMLNDRLEEFVLALEFLQEPCLTVVVNALCNFYYPPCGNSTHFFPPPAMCTDDCLIVSRNICSTEFDALAQYIESAGLDADATGLNLINCSDPGQFINPIPHCCYGAVIPSSPTPSPVDQSSSDQSSSDDVTVPVVAATLGGVIVLLALMICVVAALVYIFVTRKHQGKLKLRESSPDRSYEHCMTHTSTSSHAGKRVVQSEKSSLTMDTKTMVLSEHLEMIEKSSMLISAKDIKLMDRLGTGEFGVVYRAHLLGKMDSGEEVAVKTLKGYVFDLGDVDTMVKEAAKMQDFDHPNVLNLIGVSVDTGGGPYIVMPFMANGSLLTYLRKERHSLTVAEGASSELIQESRKQLLGMCLQIARGMEYLASNRFVHRDLAARNCMMDANYVIKVADFGLSEDVYLKTYFRQDLKEQGVKLPIKWMALESLNDGLFTEKSDVWSFGVTCWEVFTLGKTPYPGVDPFTLTTYLEEGKRLGQPTNAACSPEVYTIVQQCWLEDPDHRPTFRALTESLAAIWDGNVPSLASNGDYVQS